MKKTIYTLALLLMVCMQAMAQYGTDKVRIFYPVRHIPTFYVPEGNRYFHVDLTASFNVEDFLDYNKICDRLQIGYGWEEDRKSGDVPAHINVSVTDFIIEGMHEVEVLEKVRRHGEEFIEKYYVPHIDYSVLLQSSISVDGNSRYHFSNYDSELRRPPVKTLVISDRRFRSPRDCHNFLRDNRDVFVERILSDEVYALTDQIQADIKQAFHYYPAQTDIKICLFDSKKSPYYAKHQQAKAEIKRIIGGITLDGDLKQTIKDMQPWIEHFKEIEASLSTADKKQKSAKADMVYNLAMIYYALEIFDVSRQYCMRLFNEFGENSGKRMLRSLNDEEAEMKRHHLVSRHF
ncbi:MAG: hypothetical protein MJZ66_06165 [Bacteroidales bacterium]|nr:hypothetical protein [Bacteroidales bacterium]